jgi:hypothetical protein
MSLDKFGEKSVASKSSASAGRSATDWISAALREIRETGIAYWAERVVAAYDQRYGPLTTAQRRSCLHQATDVALYGGQSAMEHWDARACIEAARKYNPDTPPEARPFTAAQRREFEDAMAKLRDPDVPMFAREHLLAIGEKIKARQCSS